MAEPFFRFAEMVVPPVVAINGTKITYHGLENIPTRGALCSPSITPATWTGCRRRWPPENADGACGS
jgi:hypothetical protein